MSAMTADLTPMQVLSLLQFSDSWFPTGAFTHSNGLESYVQRGVQDIDSLWELIATRLIRGSARSDMVAVRGAMTAYHTQDEDLLHDLDERLSAMKVAREGREASTKIGRQLLRNGQALLNDPALARYQQAINSNRCAGHHALVHGLLFASLKMDAQTALLAFAYGLAAGQVSAALKLTTIGPTRAQQLLHNLIPAMQQAAEIALASPLDELQSFTPALEIHMMQHEHLFRRLFSS